MGGIVQQLKDDVTVLKDMIKVLGAKAVVSDEEKRSRVQDPGLKKG